MNVSHYNDELSKKLGVNENIIGILEAENIVSGSSVLKSPDPKRQIMRLQTVGYYEAAWK